MQPEIKNIVIVGGGTAGWITAGLIAAKHSKSCTVEVAPSVNITVVESPNIPSIGVGEGTWPSMRETLKTIGIEESDLFTHCDASFKQASKFIDWETLSTSKHSGKISFYYHPFSLPSGTNTLNLGNYIGDHFSERSNSLSFAQKVCYQSVLCENNLSPKQITHKAYDYIANYGYHLDANKFSELLKNHCINKFNVNHVVSHITAVTNNADNDIDHVSTDTHGDIQGELFIDCSGAKSLLLGKHYNIPFLSKKDILFNDTALAVQIPHKHHESPIASCTHSTAKKAGWIWDIGLQTRRGVGYVYSSQHTTDIAAENELYQYIKSLEFTDSADMSIRKLDFTPGYYEKFWHQNCVAVGMSAGFIEPLEASALAMIEQAAQMISDQLPTTKQTMSITAKRFNEKFTNHWQQIIEFLKLHYVLSKRDDSSYWLDNRESSTIPDSLQEMLELWQYQSPSKYDIPQANPLFPAASYQYVLYGMNFKTKPHRYVQEDKLMQLVLNDVQNKRQKLAKALEPNRVLINKIKQYGLTNI
jgi:2-polyprenyl-6-methoxyphenol hydroxylase-like FAD-dependent oxidoreductase